MKKYISLIAGLFACTTLIAQNWTGAVSSEWNNPANWSQTPSNGDDIEIDPANYTGAMAHPVVSANSSFTPAEMLVQNGAQLTISANLSASDRVEILGEGTVVTLTAGTYAVNGGGNNARLIFAEGASLIMNGGNLTAGQRLLFELGGKGEINGGTVTVGETIAIIDGNTLESSSLILNNGIITTNGEFGFENEAGEFFPRFEQNGGVLNVNGDLLWLGADAGSGRGSFIINEGLTKVTGTISNDPASTMAMTLKISGENSQLHFSGTTVSLLAGDSVIVQNEAIWKELNTATWLNNGVFHSDSRGNYIPGNSTLTGTGSFQFANIHIAALKLLNHVTPLTAKVSGDFLVEGTFVNNANMLVLNGTDEQVMTAAGAGISVYDLEINNSTSGNYGITLQGDMNISHNLKMTDGLVSVGVTYAIKLGETTTISGGSDTSFVNGYIRKTGSTAMTFPLGKAPHRYRPFSFSAPNPVGTSIQAQYILGSFPQLTPVENPLQSVSVIEYWDVLKSGPSDPVYVTLGWNNASESGLTDCADISMTVWDGDQWEFIPSTTTGLCNGDNSGTLASSVALNNVAFITIGFTESVYQQQVTICPEDTLMVGTNGYSESGTYTDVLEDVNGEDSTVITVLNVLDHLQIALTNTLTSVSATAEGAVSFQWIDCTNGNTVIPQATGATYSPASNGSYAVIAYQENCTQGDTSECVNITQLGISENAVFDFVLYPNPVSGENQFTVLSDEKISNIRLYSSEGRVILETGLPGSKNKQIIDLNNAAPGIYMVEVQTEKGKALKRLIVN